MPKFIILVSALIFCNTVAVYSSSSHRNEPVCSPWEEAKYFPHANCSKFYVCDNGHLAELECPGRLYFNPQLDVCDYPANVPECEGGTREPDYTSPTSSTPISTTGETSETGSTSTTTAPTTPPTTTTPTTSPTTPPTTSTSTAPPTTTTQTTPPTTTPPTTTPPTTSTSTAPPTTTTPTTPPTTTPPTTPPTTSTSTASPTTNAPTTSTSTEPNNCPSSGVDKIPHPSSCDRYLVCVNGVSYEVHCSDGLQFNPNEKECDFPENANCSLTPELPSTTPSSNLPECPSEGVSFHPMPGNCSFYILCAEGFPMIQKCADGTCFSEEQLKCVISSGSYPPPQSWLPNNAPICHRNEDEIKLYPSGGGCMEFHICFGQTYKGKQECKCGKHFHYFTQNCITEELSECNS